MTSQKTKAKRRNIPTFTIAELEGAGRLPPFTYLMDALDKWADQNQRAGFPMAGISIDLLREQLPDDAKYWVRSLSPVARIEIDRLLKETGIENFAKYWREHKTDLEHIERSFGTKL